jgi:hypothetical protein
MKRYWNIFSDYSNLSSVIMGWYLTWPVEALHGVMISDRAAYKNRSKAAFYPEQVFDDQFNRIFQRVHSRLTQDLLRFTDFRFQPNFRKIYAPDTSERNVSEIIGKRLAYVYRRDAIMTELGLKLLKSLDPDVFTLYLRGVDFTQHGFWKYMDPDSVPFFPVSRQEHDWLGKVIEKYYIYLDEVLGQFLQEAGEDATILVISDHGARAITQSDAGSPELSGDHTIEGIIFCKGPAFRKGFRIPSASIYDFLPTLLYVAGLPPAEDMPGKVLAESMEPQYLRNHPLKRIKSYGARISDQATEEAPTAVDEEIKEELRSLGYIQ